MGARNADTTGVRGRGGAAAPASQRSCADRAPQTGDLRLVPPALSAWLAAAIATSPAVRPSWSMRTAVAAVLLAGAAGLLLAARRAPRGTAAVLACLVCGAAAAAGAASRAEHRVRGPLAELARVRALVAADVVVTGDPVARSGRVVGARRGSDLVLVPSRVERLTAAGRSWRVRQPVLLLATSPAWHGLLPSQRARVVGRLLPPRPGDTSAGTLSVRAPPASVSSPSWPQRAAGALRSGLQRAAQVLPAEERGLLPGLVDGDTSRLDPRLREDFRATGLSHLVAVSGANCAVVLAVALALARRSGLGVRSRAVWAGAVLVGFVVLARPSPSVLRASVMGLLGVLAAASGRPRAALLGLAAAVLALILIDPPLARSPSFTLSVLATAGLLVLAPGWRDALARRMPARAAEVIAVPLAAQVACAPVIAAIAGGLSLVAVPANVLALPAVPPATVLGVLAAATSPLSPTLAETWARLAGLPCRWLVTVAHLGARLPGARLRWPDGLAGAAALALVTVLVAAMLRRPRPRRLLTAACTGLLAAQLVLVPLDRGDWPPVGWRVVACDVGQGDALVLRTGGGADVLVDAGPDPDRASGCLAEVGVRRLALVVLTHLHADHVEGLPGVLGRMAVREVEVGPLLEPADEWTRVQRWAADAHVPVSHARRGERRAIGDVSWEVLGPVTVLRGTDSDPNNSSLVMRVQLPGLSLLLTGDAERPAQEQVRGLPTLRVDVLKVPHHGSDRQDPTFLASTGARVALTSVGFANPYGHPSLRTLGDLRRAGAAVFRTDEDGSVAVLRRDGAVTVVPRRARRAGRSARPADAAVCGPLPVARTGRRDRAPPGA